MMANLSLTSAPKEKKGSKIIPSVYGEYSKTAKKYSLFITPSSQEELDRYCFSAVGYGSTVCLKRECKTSHRGARIEVKTDEAYVMKTAKEGFLIPTTSTTLYSESIIDAWKREPVTINGWMEIFDLATASRGERLTTGVKISMDDLQDRQEKLTKSLAFATPARAKRKFKREADEFIPHKRIFPNDQLPPKLEPLQIVDCLNRLDLAINSLEGLTIDSVKNLNRLSETVTETTGSLTDRINALALQIGNKPHQLLAKYDAPNLWSAIANLASILEANSGRTIIGMDQKVKDLQIKLEQQIDDTKTLEIKPLAVEIKAGKSYFVTGMGAIKDQLDAEGIRVDLLTNDTNSLKLSHPLHNLGGNGPISSSEICRLEGLISGVSNRLNKFDNLNDSDSIKFGGMGLRSKREVITWLAINSPRERGGLVVDFHTLMEHIHHSTTGSDAIAKLNGLYKLKIGTISQGLAITSFDCNIPKFFSKSAYHRVVKDFQSHFDQITDFDLWDQANDGYKDTLKAQVLEFQVSHTQHIDEELVAGSKIHTLAILSLSASVTFTTALVDFMSDTYKEYIVSKFSSKKAWSITTRLASRIISHVSVPRIGVQKTFQTGFPEKIGESIFWSTLKTLDIMAEMTNLGFRDSPIVASELVKFLALNTGFDAIETLVKSNTTLKAEVAALTKAVAGNTKTIATAANKVDNFKNSIDAINKRLAKLEAKK